MGAVTEADWVTNVSRAENERRGCIRTFSGRYVNPLQLVPEDIHYVDLAHHLSLICRYTGACPEHYSVAQHSVYVAQAMKKRHGCAEAALAGLLHDAEEAYFNDLASPVKHDPRMEWYCELGKEARRMIYEKYGIEEHWYAKTKVYDDQVFKDEVASWWGDVETIVPWGPKLAEKRFLQIFADLRVQM